MATNGSARGARAPFPEQEAVRVFVVDDHDLFRSGLCSLLSERGFRIVGEAADAESALRRARPLRPEVVVIGLEDSAGAETVRRLTASLPDARILGLSIAVDDGTVAEAVGAGLNSYLLKDASVEEIVEGVLATAAGQSVVAPPIAALILRRLRTEAAAERPTDPGLTEREREVLAPLAAGKSNVEIADELGISTPTVKNHISSILDKLGTENRIQAAVEAVRRGWA